jgi:hypothetical protein
MFPWDDVKAAHEHRLEIAGRLSAFVRGSCRTSACTIEIRESRIHVKDADTGVVKATPKLRTGTQSRLGRRCRNRAR